MNIALLSNEYPPESNHGGMATYAYTMAHALKDAGHNVWVICRSPHREEYETDDDGVCVKRVQAQWLRLPVIGRFLFRWFPIATDMAVYAYRVAQVVNDINDKCGLDLIEAREWRAEAFFLAGRIRVPTVIRLAYAQFMERYLRCARTSADTKLIEWFEGKAIRRADQLVSPSHAMARIAERHYSLADGIIKVIPHPANACITNVDEPKSTALEVLYVGRLEPKKGVETLVRAVPAVAKQFPDVRFTFVGADTNKSESDKSMVSYLCSLLDGTGCADRVEFIQQQPKSELGKYYSRSSIVVVPSWFEAFGFVALEAMSYGKPVVAADTGGLAETVEHGFSGYLFPVGDEAALAKYVIRLLNSSDQRNKMGKNGRSLSITRHSPDILLERNLAIFQGVVTRYTEGKDRD